MASAKQPLSAGDDQNNSPEKYAIDRREAIQTRLMEMDEGAKMGGASRGNHPACQVHNGKVHAGEVSSRQVLSRKDPSCLPVLEPRLFPALRGRSQDSKHSLPPSYGRNRTSTLWAGSFRIFGHERLKRDNKTNERKQVLSGVTTSPSSIWVEIEQWYYFASHEKRAYCR